MVWRLFNRFDRREGRRRRELGSERRVGRLLKLRVRDGVWIPRRAARRSVKWNFHEIFFCFCLMIHSYVMIPHPLWQYNIIQTAEVEWYPIAKGGLWSLDIGKEIKVLSKPEPEKVVERRKKFFFLICERGIWSDLYEVKHEEHGKCSVKFTGLTRLLTA